MMDLCEEELSKPIQDIISTRLTSLIELAIRTCSSAKIDPYKNDIYIETVPEDFALQVFKINSINTAKEKGTVQILLNFETYVNTKCSNLSNKF